MKITDLIYGKYYKHIDIDMKVSYFKFDSITEYGNIKTIEYNIHNGIYNKYNYLIGLSKHNYVEVHFKELVKYLPSNHPDVRKQKINSLLSYE